MIQSVENQLTSQQECLALLSLCAGWSLPLVFIGAANAAAQPLLGVAFLAGCPACVSFAVGCYQDNGKIMSKLRKEADGRLQTDTRCCHTIAAIVHHGNTGAVLGVGENGAEMGGGGSPLSVPNPIHVAPVQHLPITGSAPNVSIAVASPVHVGQRLGQLVIPHGVVIPPGALLQTQTPDGATIQVPVPPNAEPGGTIQYWYIWIY